MPRLAIVMPVFNAAREVESSLAALERWRLPDTSIVLVNDASSDPLIAPMLASFASRNPARVQTREANGGYIAAANQGAALADPGADLLFLNSDAMLTEETLGEMARALDLEPNAAACCPLSNNATFLSVPRYQQPNPLAPGADTEAMARWVRECATNHDVVEIPTPVGFCMWVRRGAWHRFGPFDAAYGRGYGEDDDFGQRLLAGGHSIICAPRAFVRHGGGSSFGQSEAVARERRVNGGLLLSRWPRYAESVREFCQRNPLRPLHERIWHALLSAPHQREQHVMHVVDRWEVEGPLRTRILEACRAEREHANHTVVVPMPDRGAWLDAIDYEFERGVRVVGLIDFPRRWAGFLRASPATEVRFHGQEPWRGMGAIEAARAQKRTVVTRQ